MTTTVPTAPVTPSLDDLARDICSLAQRAGMPDTYWFTDSRIARACLVLDITPQMAREMDWTVRPAVPDPESDPESDPDFDPDFDDAPAARPAAPTTTTATTTVAEVWTDGSASPNPGPGGWGWVTPDGRTGYGGSPDRSSTNQRMEIVAAHQAVLSVAERPLVVVSDSRYVVDGATKWWKGWASRGWTNSKNEPVANRDLWEPFIDDVIFGGVTAEQDSHRRPVDTGVTFRWVKAHAGTTLNEEADRLANLGRTEAHGGRAATAGGRPSGRPRRGKR